MGLCPLLYCTNIILEEDGYHGGEDGKPPQRPRGLSRGARAPVDDEQGLSFHIKFWTWVLGALLVCTITHCCVAEERGHTWLRALSKLTRRDNHDLIFHAHTLPNPCAWLSGWERKNGPNRRCTTFGNSGVQEGPDSSVFQLHGWWNAGFQMPAILAFRP